MNAPRADAEGHIQFSATTPSARSAVERRGSGPPGPAPPLPAGGVLVAGDTTLDKPCARRADLAPSRRPGGHESVVSGVGPATAARSDGGWLLPADCRARHPAGDGKAGNGHPRGAATLGARAGGPSPGASCSTRGAPAPATSGRRAGRGGPPRRGWGRAARCARTGATCCRRRRAGRSAPEARRCGRRGTAGRGCSGSTPRTARRGTGRPATPARASRPGAGWRRGRVRWEPPTGVRSSTPGSGSAGRGRPARNSTTSGWRSGPSARLERHPRTASASRAEAERGVTRAAVRRHPEGRRTAPPQTATA